MSTEVSAGFSTVGEAEEQKFVGELESISYKMELRFSRLVSLRREGSMNLASNRLKLFAKRL